MMAFFVSFHTTLTGRQLAACRRKLAKRLQEYGIELTTISVKTGQRPVWTKLFNDAKGAPVIVIDDDRPHPDDPNWLAELTANVINRVQVQRPQLIYVTEKADAKGTSQALRHAVVCRYVRRDPRGKWIEEVVEYARDLAALTSTWEPPPHLLAPAVGSMDEIVGASRGFRDAMEELQQIVEAPYGLVTGDPGVGKMFLIRRMWKAVAGNKRLIVVPCASFFKDYQVGATRRRFGGGREAVEQLAPYLAEAHGGLLVLHHVEKLPSSLQEELAVRLTDSSGGSDAPLRMPVIHSERLTEYQLRVLATSTASPEQLRQTGRLNAELAGKLRKRHVQIPSLRQRGPDDLLLLCEDLLQRICARQKLQPRKLDKRVASILTNIDWPENISDLVRVLEYAIRQCRGNTIRVAHLPKDVVSNKSHRAPQTLDEIVADAQRTAIENTLDRTGGDVAAAATLLGRNPKGLYRLMNQLGISTGERRRN